jgi:uncharacterized protein YbgA (DUF1722 family)/uncharacterized protein YbbK (DUF523 family)
MAAAPPAWRSPDLPIRIGVSACLLGEEVRYDGGHQKDAYLTGVLAGHVTWVPVCPELEVGMGVPREPIRLVGDAAAPRLVGVDSGTDHTARMREFARRRVAALERQDLHGYILKRASPSCGLERVKVYGESGRPARTGVGLFARALTAALPLLPVEEEGRLADAGRREHFIIRVFAHRRLDALRASAPRAAAVVGFHAAHKYLLLAHCPAAYARLGRLVAAVPRVPRAAWLDRYGEGLMRALATRATVRKHVNVLHHITGFFRKRLGTAEKRELESLIDEYARGLVPLVVPITLINHHAARLDVTYLRDQVYLRPHPKELMLRNHA